MGADWRACCATGGFDAGECRQRIRPCLLRVKSRPRSVVLGLFFGRPNQSSVVKQNSAQRRDDQERAQKRRQHRQKAVIENARMDFLPSGALTEGTAVQGPCKKEWNEKSESPHSHSVLGLECAKQPPKSGGMLDGI